MGDFFDSLPNLIRNGVQISKAKIRENLGFGPLGFGPLEVNPLDVERRINALLAEEAKELKTFVEMAKQRKSETRHLALKLNATAAGSDEWRWFHVKMESEPGKGLAGFAGLPFSVAQIAYSVIDLDNGKYLKNIDGWSKPKQVHHSADPDLVEFLLDWPTISLDELYVEIEQLTGFEILSTM